MFLIKKEILDWGALGCFLIECCLGCVFCDRERKGCSWFSSKRKRNTKTKTTKQNRKKHETKQKQEAKAKSKKAKKHIKKKNKKVKKEQERTGFSSIFGANGSFSRCFCQRHRDLTPTPTLAPTPNTFKPISSSQNNKNNKNNKNNNEQQKNVF